MAENKKSFLLYTDVHFTVQKLTDEQAGKLFKHILSYVNDENPVLENIILDITFEPIKQDINLYQKSQRRGIFHWNWKGGISPKNQLIRNSREIKYWRIAIFERDNYTCQMCENKGGNLHAHHIKEFSIFPNLRFDISNGLTLCKKCHRIIHSIKK